MMTWKKRILLGLGCFIAIVLVSGAVFEAVTRQQVAKKYPATGKLIDIGDRKIQLDCRGSGSPTVVLESGLDNLGSLSWAKVHDEIAQTTRVCAYSRAGIMWSDPAPGNFDPIRTAKDLHTALTKAGEQTPWVMVGHSLGGPHIMTFTSLYDKEVAGFVFVDASHPDQIDRFQKATGRSTQLPPLYRIPPILTDAAAQIGIVRLLPLGSAPNKAPLIVKEVGGAYIPPTAGSNLKAMQSKEITLTTAGKFRRLGNRPLVVLTAMPKIDPEKLKSKGINEEQERQFQSAWKELHDDETTWSSHSRHEILTDSDHYIQFDRPDIVVKAVREVITDVRKASK
jgi:pimeloyl-ACP methyl ester carboxylesterase